MNIEGWGLGGSFYLGLPHRPLGYLLFVVYGLIISMVLWQARRRTGDRRRRLAFAALILIAPLASLGSLVRLPTQADLVAPGQPLVPEGPAFSILGALPWLIAAGFLGELPAIAIGFVGGLARGGWVTSQALTPVATAAQAGMVSWLLRRDYQEWPGRLARHPAFSASLSGIVFGLSRGIEIFSYSGGDAYQALDYSLLRLPPILLAGFLEAGIGGLMAQGLKQAFPEHWHKPDKLITGPYNRSLASRLTAMVLVLGLAGSAVLTAANWALARASAEALLSDQMIQTAAQAAAGIPLFIQNGRVQMRQMAEDLGAGSLPDSQALQSQLRRLTTFHRLAIFDPGLRLVASAPDGGSVLQPLPLEVEAALATALTGIPLEVATAPLDADEGVQLVFLSPLGGDAGNDPQGVLAGWADLSSTPLMSPVLVPLQSYSNGEAYLTDSRGVVLFHSDRQQWLKRSDSTSFADLLVQRRISPTGGRNLTYAQPVQGYPWRVILTTPQQMVDTLALRSTVNLLAAMLSIGSLIVLAAYLSSRRLTHPLREMATTAESIARGNLEHPIRSSGEDELGRLAVAFERMRKALRVRLQEMNLLLGASQRMAASFDMGEALPPILAGVREQLHADAARIVLAGEEGLPPETYHAGEASKDWGWIDPQVLDLCEGRGRFTLENPSRARAVLDLRPLSDRLEGLTALPLQHEGEFLGALWLGYRSPHSVSEAEHRLLSILANQLGVSLANTRLYRRAEAERQRVAAILQSTPDAVIAIDRKGRLTLANAAAEAVLEGSPGDARGRAAEEVITSPELILLLTQPEPSQDSVELKVDGGRMLYASATDVLRSSGEAIGRVAVLSDITHYKVLDTLKSEFVSTVSHDLRAPLTLMRGYATMLGMVGEINEQQQEFVAKILSSVERMAKLVDDLLDLSRIETGVGLSLSSVDIPVLIEDVVASFRPQAVNKQVALRAELGSHAGPVDADPMLLRQAIANLVDNAIKYTPSGGQVIVRASQAQDRQLVSVEDTGGGIASADQPRLFEKFFRAHRADDGGKRGSGLGLAIVKSIIEQHHGRVQVESRLGLGSKFTLAFPVRQLQPEPA